MSRRDTHLLLHDMLDHAREAVSFIDGKGFTDLLVDRQLSLALVRLLEIVGEAAAQIPQDDRDRCLEIPWGPIIGARNRLIHGYAVVDLEIVWKIVDEDLRGLIPVLEDLLAR